MTFTELHGDKTKCPDTDATINPPNDSVLLGLADAGEKSQQVDEKVVALRKCGGTADDWRSEFVDGVY